MAWGRAWCCSEAGLSWERRVEKRSKRAQDGLGGGGGGVLGRADAVDYPAMDKLHVEVLHVLGLERSEILPPPPRRRSLSDTAPHGGGAEQNGEGAGARP